MTKLRFEFDHSPEDARELIEAQARTAKQLFGAMGLDASKWTPAMFDRFVQTMTISVLAHTSMWGIRRHEQQMQGCNDEHEQTPAHGWPDPVE
jgi:hypothetical protein